MSDTMMWVFAIMIVLVMGVIAMLAAGHGEPMTTAYGDRPDAVVPQDRPLVAEDLRRVRFPLALRGYRMSEVDALLDRLAREMGGGTAESADHSDHHTDHHTDHVDREVDRPVD